MERRPSFGGGPGPDPDPCPHCQGTGYRLIEEEGRTRASRCPCRSLRSVEDLLEKLGVPPRYRHCELSTFVAPYPALEEARRHAERFLAEFPAVRRGLLFMGGCGVGKTHLAVSILRRLAEERGVRGKFYDFQELLRKIRGTFDPVSRTSELELLEPVCSGELILLDDLGAEKTSLWVQDTLHFILNQRYLRNRPTLITTNFLDEPTPAGTGAPPAERLGPGSGPLEETLEERIGVRLRSRLYEMCAVVRMRGEDYRRMVRPYQ
jgi:DNA replication protein DnaC